MQVLQVLLQVQLFILAYGGGVISQNIACLQMGGNQPEMFIITVKKFIQILCKHGGGGEGVSRLLTFAYAGGWGQKLANIVPHRAPPQKIK